MESIRVFVCLAVILMMAAGCDELDDTFFPDTINISNARPPVGRVGEPYEFKITARVKNSPNDDIFDYDFELIDGLLPHGTEFITNKDRGNDFATVSGVPTEPGTYMFSVEVQSDRLESKRRSRNADEDFSATSDIDPVDVGVYSIAIEPAAM